MIKLGVYSLLNEYIKKRIAKRHIAGTELHDALRVCKRAALNGWSSTISVWTHPYEDKRSVAEKYIKIINTISSRGLESYLSIKPTALQYDVNIFEYIAKEVTDTSVRIHFDSLSPDLADLALQYFKEVRTIYDNVGYTIPARWLRSFKDAEEIAGMNVPVRIVKGQWQDPDDIKTEVEDNYLKIVNMLNGNVPVIAIATHDLRLAEKAVKQLDNSNTGVELEQFFSLPLIAKQIQPLAIQNKIKIRLYVAYGKPDLPYNLRTANERPAVIAWFVRDLLNLKPRFNIRLNKQTEVST